MQNARGSPMSWSAASSLCRARTCGGTGTAMSRRFRMANQIMIPVAITDKARRIPAVQNTQLHGFGTNTGGLIGRMSFVLATVLVGARGGMRMPEFEAIYP